MSSSFWSYIWALFSKVSTQVIQFIFILVLSRYLSPADFGTVSILFVFISVANILIDSGLSAGLILEKKISEKDTSTLFTFNLVMSFTLYLAIFVCAPLIEDFYQISDLTRITRYMALPIVFQALYIVPKTILVKDLRFDLLFWIQLLSSFISTIAALYAAIVLDLKVDALLIYYNLGAIVSLIGFWIVTKYIPKIDFYKHSFLKLFSFGALNTLSSVVDTIYENILSLLIGKYLNISQAGYYSNAKKIEEVPSRSITELISGVTFPILSKIKDNHSVFIVYSAKIQRMLYSLIFPVMVTIAIFSSEIIILVFGKEWAQADFYLAILSIAGIAIIIENTSRSFIKSMGRADIMFRISLIKRSIGILLILMVLPFNSSYLVYAYTVASFLSVFINIKELSKLLPDYSVHNQIFALVRITIPVVIYGLLITIIHSIIDVIIWQIILSFILFIIYFLVLPFFGIDDYIIKIREFLKNN